MPSPTRNTPTQAYRTGQKQRLFYSAKLHPELASNSPTSSPSSSPTTTTTATRADRPQQEQKQQQKQQQLFFASVNEDEDGPQKKPQTKELVLSYCANVLGDWPAPADYTPRFLRVVLTREGEGKGEAGKAGAAAGDL